MTKTPTFDHAMQARLEALVAEANEVLGPKWIFVASFDYCATRTSDDGKVRNLGVTMEELVYLIDAGRRLKTLGL